MCALPAGDPAQGPADPANPGGNSTPKKGIPAAPPSEEEAGVFGWSREFFGNQYVYAVISPRARGLSLGVNMNPDQDCNFDCIYCEVTRGRVKDKPVLDAGIMSGELRRMLELVRSGEIRLHPLYSKLPPELLQLRHVALSGDGEPTLCPNFQEALETVVHARAQGGLAFFKIVLISNATGLDREQVLSSLGLLTSRDEVWVKLEAGTQAYMDRVNRSNIPLAKVMANILLVARQRPVVIQSLFPMIDDSGPTLAEITEYTRRLNELKAGGAKISLVQIYSATRPMAHPACGHLRLKELSSIAKMVREETGLSAEVF